MSSQSDDLVMSVSRTTKYLECGYRYYLSYVENVPERAAAWFPQGTGFHDTIEDYENEQREIPLADLQAQFTTTYYEHVNRLMEDSPNLYSWFPSGPYNGAVDIPRREGIGRDQIAKYVAWAESNPDLVPWRLPEGDVAVEVPFHVEIGGVPVRGYIDQIRSNHSCTDYKTGNRDGDPFQLKTYKIAIEKEFDYEIVYGDFWKGKTGKTSKAIDLTVISEDEVADQHGTAYEGIKAEDYTPNPSEDSCSFCTVARYCEFSEARGSFFA